jgi:hypothetical protein
MIFQTGMKKEEIVELLMRMEMIPANMAEDDLEAGEIDLM